MKLLLDYHLVRKLTLTIDGDDYTTWVAMAFKQREVPLPGGEMGIELRYIVNSPERFEHAILCRPLSGDADEVVVERVFDDPEMDERSFIYRFEPLTMESWKSIPVEAREELERELKTDDELRSYYWNDWVPSYWTDDFQP